MKKLNKILSSILAVSMVISCCAMNVFADSKAHTLTITPSKTKNLVAGETITVEVSIDNTLNLNQCGYVLMYDTTAFELDVAQTSRVENYIDKTWLDGMKDTDGDWGYYLGNPTYSPKKDSAGVAGEINFQWAGTDGVEADYAKDNRVIGKFNIKVKTDATDGSYTFSIKDDAVLCCTTDAGQQYGTKLTGTPVTVTVGEPAPATTTSYFTATAPYGDKYVEGGSVQFQFDANGAKKGYNFTLPTKVEGAENVSLGLKVEDVPSDVTLTLENVIWK